MKYKFLFFAAVIIASAFNAGAENISAGVSEYDKLNENLSNISAGIDVLKTGISGIEQEISPLEGEKDDLEKEIRETNKEVAEIENNIANTKKDYTNLESKKSEFDINRGLGYKIGSMIPAFAVGLWISIIILIFLWRGE